MPFVFEFVTILGDILAKKGKFATLAWVGNFLGLCRFFGQMTESMAEEKKIAFSRLVIGGLMIIAGLTISAASMFSATLIAGLVAGPLIFLLGIIVAGHSLQRLVRIKKEQSAKT